MKYALQKISPRDGLNEILEWREEETGRKQEQTGYARRQTDWHIWLTESCPYGQCTDKPFPLFQYSSFILKFYITHMVKKKKKEKLKEATARTTNFRCEGNPLISYVKNFNYSSCSEVPSTTPWNRCCNGCFHKEDPN